MKDLEKALRALKADERVPGLTDEFARRAAEEGLIDVAYAHVDSPVGPIVVAATRRGLVRIAYGNGDALDELAAELSPRLLEQPQSLDPIRRELDEYFSGDRRRFSVPIDWALTRGFTRKVLRATARIPFGMVSTYRDIATRAGSPRGARAAGNALGSNPIPIVVPCHRVLHTGGGLGGYTGGIERKELLLRLEGAL